MSSPRLFETLENPLPGTDWYLRKLKYENHIGEEEFVWTVQLMRRRDGTPVQFSHESLHVAWVRAVEAAHAVEIGLNVNEQAALNPPVETNTFNEDVTGSPV